MKQGVPHHPNHPTIQQGQGGMESVPFSIPATLDVGSSFPTRGGAIMASRATFEAFGPTDTISTGSPTAALVQVDSPSGRKNGLRVTAGNGDNWYRNYRAKYVPSDHTVVYPDPQIPNGLFSSGAIYVHMNVSQMMATTGSESRFLRVARIRDSAALGVGASIVKTASGYRIEALYHNGSGVVTAGQSREITASNEVEVYLEYTSSTLKLETRVYGESTWTVEGTWTGLSVPSCGDIHLQVDPDEDVVIDYLSLGCEMDRGEGGYTPQLAKADDMWYRGTHTASATQTEAIIVAVVPEGTFNAGYARISGSWGNSAWQPLSTAKATNRFDVSGLTADTEYTYTLQISADQSTVLHETAQYTFRTLPAAGSDSAYSVWIGSCGYGAGAALPRHHVGDALTVMEAHARPLFSRDIGDQGYETPNIGPLIEPRLLVETRSDFERQIWEWGSDYHTNAQMRAAVFEGQPSDHQVVNGFDGTCAPGQALASTLVNDFPEALHTYSADTTLGDLWTAGVSVFNDWFPNLSHESGNNFTGYEKRWGSRRFGNTRWVILDCRLDADHANNQHLSSEQSTFLYAEIDAFASGDEKLLVLDTEQVWGPIGTKSALSGQELDGFSRIDNAGYQALMDYIHANVPSSKTVLTIGGDSHVGYSVTTLFRGASGIIPTSGSALKANLISSGILSGFYYSTTENTEQVPTDGGSAYGAYVLDYFDPTNGGSLTENKMCKMSGVLMTVDESAGTILFEAWARPTSTKLLNRTLNFNSDSPLNEVMSDDFDSYADDTVISDQTNWQLLGGTSLTVRVGRASNVVQSSTRRSHTDVTLSNDQYAQLDCTFETGADGAVAAIVRASGTEATGYEVELQEDGTIRLLERTQGQPANALATGSVTLSGSNTIRIEANGTSLEAFHNDVSVLTATDSTHTSGNAGIRIYRAPSSSPSARADNFSAGNVT